MSSHSASVPEIGPLGMIVMIDKSMQAFVCGLIGILPIVGLIPGIYAIICWGHVRRNYRNEWNPASLYLSWGARLASLGVLFSLLAVCALMLAWIALQFE